MKKFFLVILAVSLISILLSACSSSDEKEIRIGFTDDNYLTPFKKGAVPYLHEKGYKVIPVQYKSEVEVSKALHEGKIDASVTFSPGEINQNKLSITPVFSVPTVPFGLYSSKYTSLKEVKEGMTVYVPADTEGYNRSLLKLSDLNWLTLYKKGEGKAPVKVKENLKGIQLVKYEEDYLQDLLNKGDFVLTSGDLALCSGKKLEEALSLEQPPPYYLKSLTVKEENKNSDFVMDLQDAYHSNELKTLFASKEYQLYSQPPSASGLPDCCILFP